MKRTRRAKRKVQERLNVRFRSDDGLFLRVSVSGKETGHYRDDFEREADMPDYWGRICPNALELMEFDEED